MISTKFFVDSLNSCGINFFSGVPDSLLKDLCAYITDNVEDKHNIIAANEGGAIALAAGYYLATGNIPIVYLQNSGQGNTINPLVSLTDKDVYNIPILLLIGWRGKPGIVDEPQHVKQGKITLQLLDALGIKYVVLSKVESIFLQQLQQAISYMIETKETFAFVIEKDTFEKYSSLKENGKPTLTLSREEAIHTAASKLNEKDIIISTTGMISRELFELRENKNEHHNRDFLTVGAMGHASQIALGVALVKNDRRVFCFDGDGASLMHMGSLAIISSKSPKNFIHVVFNNGAHDSVGGQPTVGFHIKFDKIAKAMGYRYVYLIDKLEEIQTTFDQIKLQEGPIFIEIRVKKGNRKNLGRPTRTPIENKIGFMNFLTI